MVPGRRVCFHQEDVAGLAIRLELDHELGIGRRPDRVVVRKGGATAHLEGTDPVA